MEKSSTSRLAGAGTIRKVPAARGLDAASTRAAVAQSALRSSLDRLQESKRKTDDGGVHVFARSATQTVEIPVDITSYGICVCDCSEIVQKTAHRTS